MGIVNVRDSFDPQTDYYCGRGNQRKKLRPSILANPYRIDANTTREEAIELYREWLQRRLTSDDAVIYNYELWKASKYENLACWCAPKACHAEVILEEIDFLLNLVNTIKQVQQAIKVSDAPIKKVLEEMGWNMHSYESWIKRGLLTIALL